EGMHEFLKLRTPYTMIPTPAPLAEPSGRKRPTTPSHSIQDLYFTDTPTQDHLAIIDACLHDCYDVPRAQKVFDMLRDNRQPGDPVLEPRLYNSFLKAYLEMASRQAEKRVHWLEEMWALYDAMEGDSREKVPPTASTYAL
ncbi:hypothetical protein PUNSTDRAFT_26549, partial [Punctularia strigosozonata HHB-11173 SS5]|uniref:uncharacterized protein n=1 Tax=Punctularia strigosozonata (strain HHB-11173) TaxID=741275 RepID=UPI0004416966